MTNQITKPTEEKSIEFVPHGSAEKIKLSVSIIKNLIAVRTKSGKTCSDQDALKFLMLCQAQHLNPFSGDAFLIGYDGKDGPSFSLITAHAAFLKRAESCEKFEGMESGIIFKNDDGTIDERQGDFHSGEEKVIGGWAKVYRTDRKIPCYRRIRLERFDKGFAQWQVDPAGMIVKCAESDALRSSFPALLSGLYLEGEQLSLNQQVKSASELVRIVEEGPQQGQSEGQKETKRIAPNEAVSPRTKIANVVRGAGFEFGDFQALAIKEQLFKDPDSCADFDDIPIDDAKRLARALEGIVNGLAQMKEDK